jgi:serine/threonine protein kinase/Flp pilus assembly protein TadD
VLRELVRVDLELGWARGRGKRLDEYVAEFPELFQDAASVREVAFEEFRVRRQAGDSPTPDDYRRRFGVDTTDWPDVSETAAPQVGGEFLGFELVAELGRGAFGRVFLARQASLANRWIALKVSADAGGEPQALAQLQHTHIVPVFSVHRCGSWQAVCMPYLGSTTLADVLDELRGRGSWPDSGIALVSTVVNRQQRIASTVRRPPAAANPRTNGTAQLRHDSAPAGGRAKSSTAIFDALEHLNFVEAVVWIAARLADGLAHAHERGILHCDLKPANILLTDEGQPMLVDFNLAADMKTQWSAASALIGGTLPYMAPEQLQSLWRNQPNADARSDIFALGVILFELLTGRPPFPVRKGSLDNVLPEMLADRLDSPPALRCWNHSVSPAVQSIVRRCLEPDTALRYQSARQLQEDLERHLEHLPLRHAVEPSIAERVKKWTRRHPRLVSTGGVAVVAVVALATAGATLFLRGEHIARMEAAENFRRFHDASKSVQALLTTSELDPTRRNEGLAAARQALNIYGVLDDTEWQHSRAIRRLDASSATRLRTEVGHVLVAMARTVDSHTTLDSATGDGSGDRAREFNRLAELCFAPGQVPRVVWMQRAEWARGVGDAAEARRFDELAEQVPLRSATDFYQVAAEHLSHSRFHDALPLLEQARRQDSQNVAVWLALGSGHAGLGQFGDAATKFEACSALWPDSHWPHFLQGLARLDEREFAKARAAFERAIELKPDQVESYINRGLARFGLGDYAGAVQDYTHALDLGATQTRVYFMRANARDRASDPASAKQDRELGLTREPLDELSWIARGVARLGGDPQGALADFERALESNPRSRAALENKAHVLSERVGKTAEAIEVLNAAVEFHPDYIPARAGRGVLLARLGDRAAAHADAVETLARDSRPGTLYQIAGIYALTSRDQPADRARALQLLAAAIRQEPRWIGVVPKDPDLDPIRDDADFRRLMQSLADINAVGDPLRSSPK